jgi:hypothetical protein
VKVFEVLGSDEEHSVQVTKRSEIARAVASMSMATLIDFAIEHYLQRDPRNYSVEQHNDELMRIRRILKKHIGRVPMGLGSSLLSGMFDHRRRLEKLKACLDELADEFDAPNENREWPWVVTLTDESDLYT